MKRFAFVSTIGLGLIISCAPTATPQPQVALATTTLQIPTPMPTLTETPTATRTITPLPKSTSTPTITSTPTLTPIPKFVWTLKGTLVGFDGNMKKGGITEIVSDPTGSGRGLVQRSVIGSGGNPPEEETPGALVYRLYPAMYQTFHPAPCEAREDVWMSKEFVETIITGQNSMDSLDVFDKQPQDGGQYSSALQAVLSAGSSKVGGKIYLRLRSFDESDKGITAPLEYNSSGFTAPEFTYEQWHNVSIYIEPNRDVRLYQDGQLVSKGTLPSHNRVGLVGGHAGIYAYNYYKSSSPIKGYILIDNWEMRCW